MKRRLAIMAPGVLGFVVLFGLWQILVRINDVSVLVLPAPSDIWSNIAHHAGAYRHDAWVTFIEALLGFAVALFVSVVLAVAMVHFRIVRRAVDPLAVTLRCLPVVALAPGLALWLGFGLLPKVVVAALITFPPFLVNLVAGLQSVDSSMLEILESVNASPREVLSKLRLPNALPYLFTAMKVCTTLALIGAVVAEWSASSEGLGYAIISAQKNLQTTTVWGAIAVLAVMGVMLTLGVTLIEKRTLKWMTAK